MQIFLCSQSGSQFAVNIAMSINQVHKCLSGRTGWAADGTSDNATQHYTTETATGWISLIWLPQHHQIQRSSVANYNHSLRRILRCKYIKCFLNWTGNTGRLVHGPSENATQHYTRETAICRMSLLIYKVNKCFLNWTDFIDVSSTGRVRITHTDTVISWMSLIWCQFKKYRVYKYFLNWTGRTRCAVDGPSENDPAALHPLGECLVFLCDIGWMSLTWRLTLWLCLLWRLTLWLCLR